MIKLKIRKKTTKVWQHFITDGENFILSKCYCKTNGDKFRVVEDGGTAKKEYLFSEIEVYDDLSGGSAETFTSSLQLMNRLSALNYVGFSKDGDVLTADLISSDSSNALIEGADGKLYVPIVDTSSFELKSNKTDAQADLTSNTKFWSIKGVVDYFTSRWVAASLLVSGIVTTGTQFFAGNKIFRGESNTVGNALEVQNLSGTKLLEVLNAGGGLITAATNTNTTAPLILNNTTPYGTGGIFNQFLQMWRSAGANIMTLRADGSLTLSGNFRCNRYFSEDNGNGTSSLTFMRGNNGIWFPDGNKIAFNTNGGEKMRITETGLAGIGTTTPAGILDVASTTRGSLPFPRMNEAQRTAIATPATGMHVYQTDGTEGVYVRKSTGWQFAY